MSDTFRVLGQSTNCELLVSGSAGDSLNRHSDQQFTTRDRDNNPSSIVANTGTWWYILSQTLILFTLLILSDLFQVCSSLAFVLMVHLLSLK